MKTIDGLPEALLMEYRLRYNAYLKSTPNEKKVVKDILKELEKEILKLMYQ